MRLGRMRGVLPAVVVSILLASPIQGSGQGRRGAAMDPSYDLAAEVTLRVTVTEVKRVEGRRGQNGVHLVVMSGSASLEIELGPQWFLTDRQYTFNVGDELAVVGRIKRNNGDALVAREVTRGEQTMAFRDAKGLPLWAGRGRGSE